MRIHIYDNKTGRLTSVMENIALFEEKPTYYLIHTRGEKWFEQIMIDKNQYTVYIEQ